MKKFASIFLVWVLAACGGENTQSSSAGGSNTQLPPSERAIVAATAEAHKDDAPVPGEIATKAPAREVTGERVAYGELDGANLYGYLAMPADATGPFPGLIVIHEWWGMNDNIRSTAERLAGEGYAALAVDLYRGETATEVRDAIKLTTNLSQNIEPAEANLKTAYEYLDTAVGSPRIGVIGWCLGGRWALKTALLMPEQIDAMVMYYGQVVTDEAQLATLQMPILGNFASEDQMIKVASVNEFRDTLERLGKSADIKIYEGANHAFSNPSGTAYNAEAADDAWLRTVAFLKDKLAEGIDKLSGIKR